MKAAISLLLLIAASSWFIMIHIRGFLGDNWVAIYGYSIWLSVPYIGSIIAQYYKSSAKYGSLSPSVISGLTIIILGLGLLAFHVIFTGNTIAAGFLLALFPIALACAGIVAYGVAHLRKTDRQKEIIKKAESNKSLNRIRHS